MLPKTQEEILDLFESGRSVVILDNFEKPVAHAAITIIYEKNFVIEIGGVIVEAEKRRKGLGAEVVVGAITLGKEKYPGWFQIALCNSASLPLFVKLGAEVIDMQTALEKIPAEAWEACETCPNFQQARSQGKVCCDTPVSLETINSYNV